MVGALQLPFPAVSSGAGACDWARLTRALRALAQADFSASAVSAPHSTALVRRSRKALAWGADYTKIGAPKTAKSARLKRQNRRMFFKYRRRRFTFKFMKVSHKSPLICVFTRCYAFFGALNMRFYVFRRPEYAFLYVFMRFDFGHFRRFYATVFVVCFLHFVEPAGALW